LIGRCQVQVCEPRSDRLTLAAARHRHRLGVEEADSDQLGDVDELAVEEAVERGAAGSAAGPTDDL